MASFIIQITPYTKAYYCYKKHITTPILLLNYVVKLLTITSKLVKNNVFDAIKSLKNRCI